MGFCNFAEFTARARLNDNKFPRMANFKPHIVVVLLGLNDAMVEQNWKCGTWPGGFRDHAQRLLNALQSSTGRTPIIVLLPPALVRPELERRANRDAQFHDQQHPRQQRMITHHHHHVFSVDTLRTVRHWLGAVQNNQSSLGRCASIMHSPTILGAPLSRVAPAKDAASYYRGHSRYKDGVHLSARGARTLAAHVTLVLSALFRGAGGSPHVHDHAATPHGTHWMEHRQSISGEREREREKRETETETERREFSFSLFSGEEA